MNISFLLCPRSPAIVFLCPCLRASQAEADRLSKIKNRMREVLELWYAYYYSAANSIANINTATATATATATTNDNTVTADKTCFPRALVRWIVAGMPVYAPTSGSIYEREGVCYCGKHATHDIADLCCINAHPSPVNHDCFVALSCSILQLLLGDGLCCRVVMQ